MASRLGWVWQTSGSWWEAYCADQGFKGGHLADWYDFYFFNFGTWRWTIYGSWTRYHQDGCWYWYNALTIDTQGPYLC